MNLGLHDQQFRPRTAHADWLEWKQKPPAK